MRTTLSSLALVALAIVVLSAANLTMTIHSQPEGATVFEGTKLMGVTPLNLSYKLPRRWKDCLKIRDLSVSWVSGAKASLEGVSACPQNTKSQQLVFLRPDAYPNATLDLDWAFKMAQLSIEQAKVAAIQAQQATPVVIATAPKHCTSQVIGTQVFTNCY